MDDDQDDRKCQRYLSVGHGEVGREEGGSGEGECEVYLVTIIIIMPGHHPYHRWHNYAYKSPVFFKNEPVSKIVSIDSRLGSHDEQDYPGKS